jgi:hypothetical protein
MTHDECTRRAFLRKFAYLSAGAMTLSVTTMACYGPPPTANRPATFVNAINYLDDQQHVYTLDNNQSVPVHLTILVSFSSAMDQSTPVSLDFMDSANNVITNTQAWRDSLTLSVVPSSDLLYNTDYTFSVVDAIDSKGAAIFISDTAKAAFKTAAA